MTAAVLKLSPVDAPAAVLPVTEPARLTDILKRVDAPEWFSDHGVIRIDGHVIPPDRWRLVRVKPGGCQVIELAVVPGKRNTLVLLASVATAALAAAVSGGLLGPAGFGLGAAFAAGGLGATAAAAGIGLAGQLLISALTAPPKSRDPQAAGELSLAGIAGNTAQLLTPLPVVLGTMRVSPPLLQPVYTTFEDGEIFAHAVVGVEGRCAISGLLINGVDASLVERLEYETFEGTAGDAARTISTLSVMEQRDGVELSKFRTSLNANWNERLLDQDTPENSTPDWHYFETDGRWDEIWLRLVFPAGIVEWNTGGEGCVPVRIQMRKKGDVDWRALPTFYAYDYKAGAGPLRIEVKINRKTQPAGPHYSTSGRDYPVVEIASVTGFGKSYEYEADSYFLTTTYGTDQIPTMTGATTSGVTMSASSENGGNEAWRASDSSSASGWQPSSTSFPHWIKIDLGAATTVRSYHFASDLSAAGTEPSNAPSEWYWEGSTDDLTYTRLDAENVRPLVITQYVWGQIGSPGSYRYYRLNIVGNNGAANAAISLVQLDLYDEDVNGSAILADYSSYYGFLAQHDSPVEPRCRYGSITPDGCEFYLDPAQWDDGAYEVRVKRGTAFKESLVDWSASTYDGSTNDMDFFEYRTTSGYQVVRVGQRDYRSDTQVEIFSTVDYTEPFDPDGVAMIAVRVPNTQISSISAVFSGYAPTWDGTIWSEEEFETANPAAWLRKTMLTAPNPRPIPGEIIDDAELGAFYTRCVSAAHQVNAVVNGRAVGDVMQVAASCGYASPRAADVWGVVEDYDTSGDPVSQAISPLNSRDLGTEIAIPDVPHAIHAEYFDEDDDYNIAHLTVYATGYDATTATVFEAQTYDGFTNATKLQARVEFDLDQMRLRGARYLREMGQEGFTIRRGHTVMLADDVLDEVVAYGIVKTVTAAGSKVTSVTLDAVLPFSKAVTAMEDFVSAGRPMALLIRVDDGTVIEKLVTEIDDSATCTFADPFDEGTVAAGQLAVCGYYGSEKRRCRVMAVEPTGIDTRIVHLADEAPELFGGAPVTTEPAEGMIAEWANGVAVMFIYRSMSIKDNVTPANDYSGDPSGALTFTRASAASVWRDQALLTAIDSGEFALDEAAVAGTRRGIRIEGANTNLCLRSQDFSHANWTAQNVTVTANAAAAPDGTTTADAVVASAVTARHAIGKNSLAVTADATYAWSVYIKPIPGSATLYPVLYVTEAGYQGSNRAGVVFDLANVAYQTGATAGSGAAIVDKGIEALPNGWYRIWAALSEGNADAAVGFHLSWLTTYTNSSFGESYLGDGTSGFYLWGAQIENDQAFASSYIPADAASATRAADSVTLPVTDFNFDTTSGTLSVVARSAPGDEGTQVVAQIDDGSEDNRIRISRSAAGSISCNVRTGGVDGADISLGTIGNDERFGVSLSWATDNVNASLNGAAAVADSPSTCTIPTGLTTLRIGRASNSVAYWYGHIETVRHVNSRASSAQLPALSAI